MSYLVVNHSSHTVFSLADLVWKEWIENLALRRVYFLEHDHYAERLNELNEIQAINVSKDPMQATHLPWLPHPELRETVPNVSLYSCLYQLPRKITTVDLPDTATDLQRQIAATVNFFNLCVPNQPGFSSSVAAVTILPEPAHVAQAWKKWYYCGKKLTQLRYLRSLIQMHLERQNAQDEEWVTDEEAPKEEKHIDQMHPQDCIEETAAVVIIDETLPLLDEMSEVQEETPDSEMLRDSQEISSHNISTTRSRDGDRLSVFKYSNFDSDHFARSIGLEEETKLKNMVSGIDIEQLSVYAREYAQRYGY